MDDIILKKAEIIERCTNRIKEEYVGHEQELTSNYTRQDSIILNLQRACEAAIDMGTRVIRLKNLGLPQSSREVFELLETAHIIQKNLSEHLQAMVGFRNIAIHNYTNPNLEIVRAIVEQHLQDFSEFNKILIRI